MKREYGIDFMRIVAMFLIILGHIVGQGGVLTNADPSGTTYYAASFWIIFSLCAINIFGLISGYVGIYSSFKIKKLFLLWLKVIFWTVTITVIFILFIPGTIVDIKLLKLTFLPVTSKAYWYITSYFIVYLLSPLINRLVINLSNKTLECVSIISVIVLSIILTTSGNNPIWLCLLYFIGATIRKCEIPEKLKRLKISGCICIFLFLVVLTLIISIIQYKGFYEFNKYEWAIFGGRYNGLWPSSITMFLSSVVLLFVGIRLQLSYNIQKILKKVTPLVVSVYLIHVHPLVFDKIYNFFAYLGNKSAGLMSISVLVITLSILVVCLGLDQIRAILFEQISKLLHKVKINQ